MCSGWGGGGWKMILVWAGFLEYLQNDGPAYQSREGISCGQFTAYAVIMGKAVVWIRYLMISKSFGSWLPNPTDRNHFGGSLFSCHCFFKGTIKQELFINGNTVPSYSIQYRNFYWVLEFHTFFLVLYL